MDTWATNPSYASPPLSASTVPLLAGDAGVAQTVVKIFEAQLRGLQDPEVNMFALRLMHGSPVDNDKRARRIFDWVRDNITFVDDPVGHDTVRDARFTLMAGAGDCDCVGAVLLPTLCGIVGIPTRLVTVACDPTRGEEFSHIYCEAYIEGRGWLCLDASRQNPKYGVPVEYSARTQVWEPDFGASDNIGMGRNLGRGLGVDLATIVAASDPTDNALDSGLDVWNQVQDTSASPVYVTPPNSNFSSWSASDFAAALTAGGNAAANIIRAANSPNAILPSGFQRNIYGQIVGPNGQVYGGASLGTNLSPTTMILIAAVLGIALLKRN